MIKELSISGFRGYATKQVVPFALPNKNTAGSGLTIITGPNNSGKTTIIESLRAFNSESTPSFSEGKRNHKTGGIVEICITEENGNKCTIRSVSGRGSSTEKESKSTSDLYFIPSRRSVNYEFGKIDWSKKDYVVNGQKLESSRSYLLQSFESRIFQIEKDKAAFDSILSRVLGYDFQWTIEQRDSGNYYIKCTSGPFSHSSEGLGDGIWSVFVICSSLFDSKENATIVIDEPELSIHPSVQKRLMNVLVDYSTSKQIIVSTHSPYFINWQAIENGATLIRVIKDRYESKCFSLSDGTRNLLAGVLKDINNPHTLGLEANEVFFLDDKIILVEGQEDVIIFRKISQQLNIILKGDFFGWGVGGAAKMDMFLSLLKDLGYKHVFCILDGDKRDTAEKLKSQYHNNGYQFETLLKDDIRDKKQNGTIIKEGITTEDGTIKTDYKNYVESLFNQINNFFA